MKSKNKYCEFLQWDSNFFDVKIARLNCKTLTEEVAESAFQWCRENEIDCLYFLADPNDKETANLTRKHKFKLTDIKISLEANLKKYSFDGKNLNKSVKAASLEDIEQLKKIAAGNHHDSRFYYDGNFPSAKCDELFATWIENSCRGYADVMLVSKNDDIVQGYITCSIDSEKTGNIGLVGVNPDFQGIGVGRILVTSALDWFSNSGASHITVVTQGRNIKAQRLYQKNGFVTESLEIWYHRWFTKN